MVFFSGNNNELNILMIDNYNQMGKINENKKPYFNYIEKLFEIKYLYNVFFSEQYTGLG